MAKLIPNKPRQKIESLSVKKPSQSAMRKKAMDMKKSAGAKLPATVVPAAKESSK